MLHCNVTELEFDFPIDDDWLLFPGNRWAWRNMQTHRSSHHKFCLARSDCADLSHICNVLDGWSIRGTCDIPRDVFRCSFLRCSRSTFENENL